MAKEDKRIDILRAASRVFYLRGFEGTKIDDIAKEAGIGKGTVYEYYHSKQELFDKAVSYNREQYIEQVKATLSQDGTLRDKFIAFAKYQTELVKTHIPIFNMMANSKIMAREVGALILEQNIQIVEMLSNLIKDAVMKGEMRADINPEIAASIMIGTLNQYCSKKVIFSDILPEAIDYEEIADTIFKGIGH